MYFKIISILIISLFLFSPNVTFGAIKNFSNGDKYEGDLLENKKHGYGTYYWKNSTKYQGQWKDEYRDGIKVHEISLS